MGQPVSETVVSADSPTATIMLRGGSSDDAEFTFHMDTDNADSIHNIFGRALQKMLNLLILNHILKIHKQRFSI